MRFVKFCGAFTMLLLAIAPAAWAAVDKPNQFELFGGYYFPSDIEIGVVRPISGPGTIVLEYDDSFIWGARYGYRVSEPWGVGVSWSHLELDANAEEVSDIGCSTCDASIEFIDFSFEWYPGGGDWSVFGGLGWATGEFEINLTGDSNDRRDSDDAFTYHVGTAWTWHVGESFYLRPDVRVRFLELDASSADAYDTEDPEVRLGFGWAF